MSALGRAAALYRAEVIDPLVSLTPEQTRLAKRVRRILGTEPESFSRLKMQAVAHVEGRLFALAEEGLLISSPSGPLKWAEFSDLVELGEILMLERESGYWNRVCVQEIYPFDIELGT